MNNGITIDYKAVAAIIGALGLGTSGGIVVDRFDILSDPKEQKLQIINAQVQNEIENVAEAYQRALKIARDRIKTVHDQNVDLHVQLALIQNSCLKGKTIE